MNKRVKEVGEQHSKAKNKNAWDKRADMETQKNQTEKDK